MPVAKEKLQELSFSTPDEHVLWRIDSKKGNKVRIVPYVDARRVYRALNHIVGVGNWCSSSIRDHQGEGFTCVIRILVQYEDGSMEWIHHSGSSDDTKHEGYKGGESRALCRAAAKFGLYDDLYDVDGQVWVKTDKYGNFDPPSLSEVLAGGWEKEEEAEEEKKPEKKRKASNLEKKLHIYGNRIFSPEQWDEKRHKWVKEVTNGKKKGFSDNLNDDELFDVEDCLRSFIVTDAVANLLPKIFDDSWVRESVKITRSFFDNDDIENFSINELDDEKTDVMIDFYLMLKEDAEYCQSDKPKNLQSTIDTLFYENDEWWFEDGYRIIKVLVPTEFLLGLVEIDVDSDDYEEHDIGDFVIQYRMDDNEYVLEKMIAPEEIEE